MEFFWWAVAIVLMAIGLIGTVLPIFPGTAVILAGAVLHRVMLGPVKGIAWLVIALLVLLALASYALDFAAGFFGARYFGATRWDTIGAILGALAGIFFGLVGIFIGPIIGAVAGEFLRARSLVRAGRAGWGTLLGNLGGMIGKLIIGLAMVVLFLMNAPSPF